MTNKINGIDVSEYFINHYDNSSKLYAVEYKGNPLELQNAIKRLQEENKRLQMLSCANCGEKYLSPDGAELYEKNVQLQEENEELKQERLEVARLFDKTCRCDDLQEDTAKCQYFNDDCISIRHCMKKFKSLKDSYKQALKEIRNIADELITETPEYNSCYYKDECGDNCTPKKQSKVEYCCYENTDKILTIIDEALNDRD